MVHRPRIVIVGAGFAGFHAARTLARWPAAAPTIVADQPHRLLPLPAAAARGRGRHARAAPGLGLADRGRCPGCGWCSARSTRSTWTRAPSATPIRRAAPRRARLRPAGDLGGQREQAAAGARCRRARARLPRHPRGALPARPHHPADRDGRARADDPAERAARCTFVVVGAGLHRHRGGRPGVLASPTQLAAAYPALRDHARSAGCCSTLADRVLPGARPAAVADRRQGAARARRRDLHGTVVQEATARRRAPDRPASTCRPAR